MRTLYGAERLAAATGSASVGALCGVLLAAFGGSVSGSPLGVSAVVLLCTLLGVWGGGFRGAILGATVGGLGAAFCHLIGGTVLGAVLTVAACAVLGGWLRWACERRAERRSAGGETCRRAQAKARPHRAWATSRLARAGSSEALPHPSAN